MPLPLMAGIAIGQSILNAGTQVAANIAQRKFTEKMYNRQRQDSLADWAMQNEYNSPTSQMARLKDAGLNPNLVYGTGVSGASGMASPVRSSQAGSYHPDAPRFTALEGYLDAQVRQAQIDNVKQATTASKQDVELKKAQILATLSGAALTGTKQQREAFQLALDQQLRDVSVDAKIADLNKTLASTQFQIDENERRQIMLAPNLETAAARIAQMRAQTATTQAARTEILQRVENLKKSGALQDLELNLQKAGINKTDPWYARMLMQLLTAGSGNPRGYTGNIFSDVGTFLKHPLGWMK